MSNRLENAHIFSAGTWNGLDFTEEDLDRIVAAFDKLSLGGRVPLKFGHNDSQPLTDGQPALGWVEKVWRDGKGLMATFRDVPKVVYEAVKRGLYKFVSVEMLRDLEREGEKFPYVLDAVALLGADRPAVGNLRDLQALTLSRASDVRFSERVAFALADPQTVIKESKSIMDNDAMKARLAELEAQNASLADKVAKAEEREKAQKVLMHREKLSEVFERGVKSHAITPAQRDVFTSMLGVDDDERVLTLKIEDVEKLVGTGKTGDSKRMAFSRSGETVEDTSDDDYTDPSAEVVRRAEELMDAHPQMTFAEAKRRVFARDKNLGQAYIFQFDN